MIDFTTILTDLDGKPVKDGVRFKHHPDGRPFIGQDGAPVVADPGFDVTLGHVARNALLMPHADERDVSAEAKQERWLLAARLKGAGVTLTAEQIVLVKKLINKAYPSPIIVGQVLPLLDPASGPKTQE